MCSHAVQTVAGTPTLHIMWEKLVHSHTAYNEKSTYTPHCPQYGKNSYTPTLPTIWERLMYSLTLTCPLNTLRVPEMILQSLATELYILDHVAFRCVDCLEIPVWQLQSVQFLIDVTLRRRVCQLESLKCRVSARVVHIDLSNGESVRWNVCHVGLPSGGSVTC